MTPALCREARALLGMSRDRLCSLADLPAGTLDRFENGTHPAASWTRPAERLAAIRTALEQAGVEFIEENGGGAGVRLRRGEG